MAPKADSLPDYMMNTTTPIDQINQQARALQPWIAERRRHLHRHPELSFEEAETAAYVRREIESMGLKPGPPIVEGRHGFCLEFRSPQEPDKFVLFRADMDALPIMEETGVDFSSNRPGLGHLCGHDAHTSMLLGAVNLLRGVQDQLPISVRCVFQHAEEVAPGGAIDFVRAGACNDVVGCFAIHVSPKLETGVFGLIPGEAMASVGSFRAVIRGRGGHGASPHESRDPILASAACICALQQIVSRRISPIEPAVVSTTMIQGGTAFNVIPGEASFAGTLRTFNEASAPVIESLVRQVVTDTARAYGCEAEVESAFSYPPLVNHPQALEVARNTVGRLFGEAAATPMEKGMGAEDFAYFARERPTAFLYLGVRPPGAPYYPLHHPKFIPDESALWMGAAYLASIPFAELDTLGTTG